MNAKFKEIINSNQLILVDFYADWCGPCKMMSPILQEVKGIIKDDVKIIKINRSVTLLNIYEIPAFIKNIMWNVNT